MSGEAASTAFSMIARIFSGSALYLSLLNITSNCSAFWWIALQHADLGDVGEAEQAVRRGVVELGRVQQAAVHRRHDLAAGQRVHRGPEAGEHVNRDAHRAELEALEVLGLGASAA